MHISTHALTEGDSVKVFLSRTDCISTHALTEGDIHDIYEDIASVISTHALTEGDRLMQVLMYGTAHFNSRPHGGRLR